MGWGGRVWAERARRRVWGFGEGSVVLGPPRVFRWVGRQGTGGESEEEEGSMVLGRGVSLLLPSPVDLKPLGGLGRQAMG